MLTSNIARRVKFTRLGRLPQRSISRQQIRSFGNKTYQFDPGLGGPGGAEVYPYSQAFHREYALETAAGVVLSGIAMYYLKRFQKFKDAISPKPVGTATILVHDDSKGVLDDVKMLRPEDLGRMRTSG